MKAKLNVDYTYWDVTIAKDTEVVVHNDIMADSSDVLNRPEGVCYLCETRGFKDYIPIKHLVITDYSKEIDWEQRRFELVKSLSSSVYSSGTLEDYTKEQRAAIIISQADKIIKQLKEE